LQAAIGESQLRRVDRTLARNAGLASRYCEALRGIPGIRFPPTLSDRCEPVVWLACVQVPMGKRSAVIQAAREAKIEMRPFFHPLSSMPPYARFAACCPNSLELGATGINLPTSDAVDDQVIDRVSRIFRDVLR
jgi:perosamine synthetase